MVANKVIDVKFTVYTSTYSIRNNIPKLLARCNILSFDVETRSVYNKEERKEAADYAKETTPADSLYKHAMLVSNTSGLSYPSLTKTTHFIFGESRDTSHIVICTSPELEMFLWNLVADYKGKLLVHNLLFDLKIMYERVGRLPVDYVDTSLMVKCLINHVDIWKAKTGLKDLMGGYYNPKWSLMEDYEPEDLKKPDFILYCAIDGASCFYLYELILEEMESNND